MWLPWCRKVACLLPLWKACQAAVKETKMKPYTLMVSMAQSRTRLLLLDETDEIMRAELPAPPYVPRHPRAMTTMFEGLARWLGCKLSRCCVCGCSGQFILPGISRRSGRRGFTDYGRCTSPRRMAMATASVRDFAFSFSMIWLT